MIRAVLFDLDGTLFDRSATLGAFFRNQLNKFEAAFASVDVRAYMDRALELDHRGHVRKDAAFFSTLETEFSLPAGLGSDLHEDYSARFPESCVPAKGMAETLSSLRASGYGLGIVTNGSERTQTRTLTQLRLHERVDIILISEIEGVRKPDQEIFGRALRRLDVTAGEAAFVGDHPESDVGGAARCGMKAIWYRDDFWDPPVASDATIVELGELPSLLESWRARD